jgi:hypothetical protein
MKGRYITLLASILCCSVGYAEEAVEIPLREIWAYEMPGTKDVRELEPDVYGDQAKSLSSKERDERFRKSVLQSILSSLDVQPKPELGASGLPKPKEAFVVESRKKRALHEADVVLSGAKEASKSFPVDSKFSLVFHSLQAGIYVHLTTVTLDGNQIEVHFRFVPHFTDEMSSHFALIPLPDLSTGQYRMTIVEDPLKDYKLWGADQFNPKWREKYVCKDFEFKVD